MNERLKRLRKKLAMNQHEFAKKLDMAQTSYSKIETGENKLTDKNISLICYVFGVNESWLRTGAEDMFISKDLAETPEERELLGIFRRLTEDMKDFFLNMGRELVKKRESKAEKQAPGGATRPPEAPQGAEPEESTG
jgi:transcriptional regulator with XRE-family HTH domain